MDPRRATTEPLDTDRPGPAAELPTEKAFVCLAAFRGAVARLLEDTS
jgi:hypothetical protein